MLSSETSPFTNISLSNTVAASAASSVSDCGTASMGGFTSSPNSVAVMLSTRARLSTSLTGESLSRSSSTKARKPSGTSAASRASSHRLFTRPRSATPTPSSSSARMLAWKAGSSRSPHARSRRSSSSVETTRSHTSSVSSLTFWSVRGLKTPSSFSNPMRISSRLLKTCLTSWSCRTAGWPSGRTDSIELFSSTRDACHAKKPVMATTRPITARG